MRNIFTLLLTSLGLAACQAQEFKSLSINEYERAIADPNVVRLDVRTAEEYAQGHIDGAINIDVQRSDFESIATATLPQGKTVAVNCRSGKRSKVAAQALVKKGFSVIELDHGYNEWTAANKSVSREEVDLFCTTSGTLVRLFCTKHGSVRVQIGDKWLYVDPVGAALPPVVDYSTMPKADVILVTHEHHDHHDPAAIEQLKTEQTLIIANPNVKKAHNGQEWREMKNGETLQLPNGWQLEAVAAYNTSDEKQNFHPRGRDNGYVLTVDGMRIYFAGDTEPIDEMKALKGVDVAFLPCNLPYTMTPEQLVEAAKMVQPRVLFPYHYGQTDIQQVVRLLEGSSIDVRIRQYQ